MRAFKIVAAVAALGAFGAIALMSLTPTHSPSEGSTGLHYPDARYGTLEIHPSYHSPSESTALLDRPAVSIPGPDSTLMAPVEEAVPYRYPASQKTYVF